MAIWRITNRIESSGQGGDKFNVFHARRDTTGPSADRFLELLQNFYTALDVLYPGQTTITIGESVVDVETQEFVESTPLVYQQTQTRQPAPELLQLVVPWRTAVRARRGMGRTFLGPLQATMISTTGNPAGAGVTAVEAAADAFVTESESLGLGAMGVWGYQNAKPENQPRPDGDPKVLRDIIGRGPVRTSGFSYLRSRRD